MPNDNHRKGEAKYVVTVHGSAPHRVSASVVQKIPAHDEQHANARDHDAGTAIAAGAPAATQVKWNHGAENHEGRHRGGAV